MFLIDHLKPPHLAPAFLERLHDVSANLGCDPQHLLMIMHFETKLNPSARNTYGGAAGLIQIAPRDARRLGTTVEKLAILSPVDQLTYIERYLSPHAGKFSSLRDTWLACYFPDGLLKGDGFYFRLPEKYYNANKVFHTQHPTNRTWSWRVGKDLMNYFIRLGYSVTPGSS